MTTGDPDRPTLVDIGVNLTNNRFRDDIETVLQGALDNGVTRCIVTGTSIEASEQAVSLCRRWNDRHPGLLYATAGVHPHDAKHFDNAARRSLAALADEREVVAVGETGLDFNRNFSDPADQERAFEEQLALAVESGLPVFLHERDAHRRQIEILRDFRDQLADAVIHCFTGDRRSLYNYLDLDLHVGVTGWVCDERRGRDLQEAVADIPADRLMIETDAPYLLPRTLEPRPANNRNEPAYLPAVLAALSRHTGRKVAELAATTTANAVRFFRLPE